MRLTCELFRAKLLSAALASVAAAFLLTPGIALGQVDEAVLGPWREAFTGAGKFSDNSRVAELKAIGARLGRSFAGGIATDMRALAAIGQSATISAEMEETGRRVRVASGLVSKEPG